MTNQARHILLLAAWALTVAPSAGGEPRQADARAAFRQLARLRAGLAYQAREKERSPVKAGLFYLQAAQAFRDAGDDKAKQEALVEGIVAAQPLRASWVHRGGVVAMSWLPGDNQFLTCGGDASVHVWDATSRREVRSFQAGGARESVELEGGALSPDRSRLLVWERKHSREQRGTLRLWDVGKGRLLREWDRGWQPGSRGGYAASAGAVFLNDGKRLLLWGTDKPAEMWDADGKGRLQVIDKGSVGDSASLSRDGSRLLTEDQSAVYLWDLARGKLLRVFKVRSEGAWPLGHCFSPDGKRVLVIGRGEYEGAPVPARLFDVSTGKRLAMFAASPFIGGHPAVFSPDGTRLLTWGKGRTVQMWDVEHGRLLETFGRGEYLSARFHRGGTQVLTQGEPVRLWDVKTGKPVGRYGDGYASFTRDGSRLLIRNVWKNQLEIWDAKSEKQLWVLHTPGEPRAVRLTEDETRLLVSSGTVQLWDLPQSDGREHYTEDVLPRARVFKHDKPLRTAALSRDEALLLTCDEGDRAHLWDAARGWRVRSFAHGDGILGAAFNPDESRVLTWGEKGVVKLWETKTGKELRTFDHPADVHGAAFSPDGSHLLTRDADYTVWWWDVSRRQPVHKFEHPRDVFGAGLSPKATRILTWGLDGKARLWSVASGRQVRTLAHDGPVFGAIFASDARVWTWSPDGLREWDATTGKVLRHQRPPDGVASAELSPDGKWFLLRTAEGRGAQLWDAGAGRPLVTFDTTEEDDSSEGAPAGVFNRDQTRILTWPCGSARLYDLASRVRLKWFRHPGTVRGAAFTRDESLVLTWGSDGTARLWDAWVPRPLSPDDQLQELEVRSGLRMNQLGELQRLGE